MRRNSRRLIKVPINKTAHKTKNKVTNRILQNDVNKLSNLDELIEKWSPKTWIPLHSNTRILKISRSRLKIDSLIDRLANREIYCKIRIYDDYFECNFIHNKGDTKTIKKDMQDYIADQERERNYHETGIYENNSERKIREEELANKILNERIARFGNPKKQLFRTKYELSKKFPSVIHCREYILKNSLCGIDTSSLKQRIRLTHAELENLIDASIEVRLLKTKTEPEEWVSFNENWKHLYPFNKIREGKHSPCGKKFKCKGSCSDKNGNRVYVLQFKNENSIYSGGTNKCLYWRYHQHSICEKSNNCEKLMYRHDPKQGLRWDLMHKFYSDDFVYSCDYKEIERWLNQNLTSCGYIDYGDGGKEFSFSS